MTQLPRITLFRLAIAWGAAVAVLLVITRGEGFPGRHNPWGMGAAIITAAIPLLDRRASHALLSLGIVLTCSALCAFLIDGCTGYGTASWCILVCLGMLWGLRRVGLREHPGPHSRKRPRNRHAPAREAAREFLEFSRRPDTA